MQKITYEELLQIKSVSSNSCEEQLQVIGLLFDLSLDRNDLNGTDLGLSLSEQIDFELLNAKQKSLFQYYLANGWSVKRILKSSDLASAWEFNMFELSKEIFHLRKAISLDGFKELSKERQCQIYTNLGNSFNTLGRFVEAQEVWSKALAILPNHAMALSNKGKGLHYYGKYIFDEIHSKIFFLYAFLYVKKSLEYPDGFFPDMLKNVTDFYSWLKKHISEELQANPPDLNDYSLGDDIQLKQYRLWCLEQGLFVNPLNDLGTHNIASHDCLNMPVLTFEFDEPPKYLTLFNQMKQEYGSARFLFYESLQNVMPHFSDTDIVLLDTMEGAQYSLSNEKSKIAFRILYSIFDKIAFFLNDYFKLGVDSTKVNFRTIWYDDYSKKLLKPVFTNLNNWAIRGLFWVSKDLHMSWEFSEVVIEPEAKELAAIRNHIEHKFFKLVSDKNIGSSFYDEKKDISFTIEKDEFNKKVLKLLKLVRASLIYLSLAVNQEEKTKTNISGSVLPVIPVTIPFSHKF